MKRVLIIEDNGIVYNTIKEELGGDFETVRVSSYATAKGRWERERETFDCIVLDLQINPLGLELKEIDKYAPLYGLAVLDAFSEGKSEDEKTQIRRKTIIYSGYTGELRYRNCNIKNLEIIAKEENSITDVINRINGICSRS